MLVGLATRTGDGEQLADGGVQLPSYEKAVGCTSWVGASLSRSITNTDIRIDVGGGGQKKAELTERKNVIGPQLVVRQHIRGARKR